MAKKTQKRSASAGKKPVGSGKKPSSSGRKPVKSKDQQTHLRAALDGTTVAIMTVDRDSIINFANRATMDLLRKYEPEFRAAFPRFSADAFIGTCIDMFHKAPEHQRRLLSDPANLPIKVDIKVGRLIFQTNVTPIVDEQREYVGNTLEWQEVTALRSQESEIARLQSALLSVTTPVMMIDRDFVIRYANDATRCLLARRENELRTAFPRFEASKIVGTCIDDFHKRPEYQRNLLSDPSKLPHVADIHVGDLTFLIKVTATLDAAGKYIGNTLEWDDVTEQRDGQREIERLIQAATEGRLRERIETSRYEGFMKAVATGINNLMDSVMQPIGAASDTVESLARGDLTVNMNGAFQGEFAQLQTQLNASLQTLATMVTQINQAAQSINSGAADISEGNANLDTRTQEQSSSLEETASSLEELTATVKQNANNANQANQLAAGPRLGRKRWASGQRGGQGHERDHRCLEQGRGHHQRDRADRVPNQHARAERRGRSCACR